MFSSDYIWIEWYIWCLLLLLFRYNLQLGLALNQPALNIQMLIEIHDKHKITLDPIKDVYKDNSTLRLETEITRAESQVENGSFVRTIKLNVPPTRLLQSRLDTGELYEKFDILFNLGGKNLFISNLMQFINQIKKDYEEMLCECSDFCNSGLCRRIWKIPWI